MENSQPGQVVKNKKVCSAGTPGCDQVMFDKISVDRRKPDAIQQDNGRMTLKAFWRTLRLLLPSQAQNARVLRAEWVQRRGPRSLWDLEAYCPGPTQFLLHPFQCSVPWLLQHGSNRYRFNAGYCSRKHRQ